MSYKRHGSKRTVTGGEGVSRDLKQRERWRPRRQKWQPEVDIFSLSVLSLDKYVQQGLKQRYSDSSCQTEAFHQASHQTAGCTVFMTSGTSACSLLITLGICRVDTVSYGRKLKVRSCYKIDVQQTFRSNPKLIQLEFKGQPDFSTIFVIHPSYWNIW